MIAICCDHAAFEFKQELMRFLQENGHKFKDFGCYSTDSADYPDFALAAAKAVADGECSRGIIMCGTGIGMSIAANKVRGIRCAVCSDEFSARATREHNNANMLALGVRVLDPQKALSIAKVFLETPFSDDERHLRRINKITEIEKMF